MEFNFGPKVDSLEVVPKDFRGLYQETDDGIVLRSDDEGVKSAVSAITGLTKALKAARAEAVGFKSKAVDLSELSDYGSTPTEILEGFKNKLAESSKDKKSQADIERQVDKIKADLAGAHSKELEAATNRAEALRGQLYTHLVTSTARTALAEASAIDADLALPFLQQQVKVVEEEGKFSVHVVDQTGDPRYSGVTGSPMSVKELVEEMKVNEKYGPLFKSEAHSGGGTPPENRRPPGQQQTKRDEMTPAQKIRAGIDKRTTRR